MKQKFFVGSFKNRFYRYLSSLLSSFFQQKESVHGSMAFLTLLVTLFLQIYGVVSGANISYFLEIMITNYSFILTIMGIRGYFNSRNLIYTTNNNQTNTDQKDGNR